MIRNRIIAALSYATVVIQSQSKGGSMIIANFTHQYNRELFAFPGEVGNPLHQGFHDLIYSKKVQLITSAQDLVRGKGWESEPVSLGVQKNYSLNLTKRKKPFLSVLNPFPLKDWISSQSLGVFPSGRPRLYCWNWR